MKIMVMKFGGTSVADPARIHRAAERAVAARKKGDHVVAVISAPGDMTDELTALAKRVCEEPDKREMDMLLSTGEQVGIALFAIAVKNKRCDAISLTGPQAGIEADSRHTQARIVRIRPRKILEELRKGRIVAVAGFQGINPEDDITTLGRGGSDLTAVALAAALKARACEIYTDVSGVYTADPRLVPEARKIPEISYEEMLELSSAGAQVMYSRSIEVAQSYGVVIHVRSSFDFRPGTFVRKMKETTMEKANVSGLALSTSEVRFSVVEVPDQPGVAARILSEMARNDIPVDMIVQSAPTHRGVNDISLMTPRHNRKEAKAALEKACRELGAQRVDEYDQIAKISVIGTGFRHHSWVAAKVFETLAKNKINIHMISTSDLKISCVVPKGHEENALRALHKAFQLHRPPRK